MATPQQHKVTEERHLIQNTVYVTGSSNSGQCGIAQRQITSWTALTVPLDDSISPVVVADPQQQEQEPLQQLNKSISLFGSRQSIDHQIVKVRCGGNFSLFLSRNGQVFGIGDSHSGAYGRDKSQTEQNTVLFEIEALRHQNIVNLDAGFNFSYFLTGDGRLFRCGSNSDGQLSTRDKINDILDSPIDQSLFGGYPVVQVSCGGNFVCALTSDNKFYACGQDSPRQLSLFTQVNYPSLEGQVIKKISCGGYHLAILTENGVIYGTGSPLFQAENLHTIQETMLPLKVRDIICGYNYLMCIGEDGRLYGSVGSSKKGLILDGQLGSTDSCPRPHDDFVVKRFKFPISEVITGASSTSTFVILSNGEIYVTGCNERGGLGVGDTNNRATFKKLPRTNQKMAMTAATGAFHSVLSYYDATLHTSWQNTLWMIKRENKLIDLDILFEYN